MGNPFSKPKAPPPPPPPKDPTPMPVADDPAVQTQKRREAADRARRSGRVSTILSQGNAGGSGKLGG